MEPSPSSFHALAQTPPTTEEVARFAAIVGDANALLDASDREAHDVEQRDVYHGSSALVLRPGSTQEVSEIVALAAELGRPLVPQGGNTGLVGAGVARGGASARIGGETGAGLDIVVSLGRMNAIRECDPRGNTMTVEAGCVLDTVRARADDEERLFPLALGSGGTAQIGGLISSNAGGTGVLAYGNTRELVLGLEAVLPDGRVWNGLTKLRKNNTGYDIKHLLIGGEGTLGVVTAAVLKLFPKPAGRQMAMAGMASPDDALKLFERLRGLAGQDLTGFELIGRTPLSFALEHTDDRDPLSSPHEWYALIEVSSGHSADDARETIETGLGEALDTGIIADAMLAESEAQGAALWKLRENCSWAQRFEGASIKHDISLPVHALPEFIERSAPVVEGVVPGARVVCFGHMGDGNLHYNVSPPVGMDDAVFMERYEAMNDSVFALVLEMDGSISAEHGIGQQKRARMEQIKSPVELDAMRAIKRALDPKGIMNPGKLL